MNIILIKKERKNVIILRRNPPEE